ncbi:hypothetical protein ACS0TY_009772 [Phlomoides rotata]
MDAQQQQRAGPQPPRPPAGGTGGGGGGGDFTAIFTVLLMFLAIAAMIIVPSSTTLRQSLSVLHQVPEGHVGVYWRGGALLNTITDPGFHLKMPMLTNFEPIQVTLQTDLVRDIPCGTKGGVMINFEKIEVVNRLHKDYVYDTLRDYGVQYDNTWIYDKIHHEINQFCSCHSLQQVYIDMFDQIDEKMKDALQADCTRYAPGIEIISVRVTKPSIPDSIRRNFEQMEEERTKVYLYILILRGLSHSCVLVFFFFFHHSCFLCPVNFEIYSGKVDKKMVHQLALLVLYLPEVVGGLQTKN